MFGKLALVAALLMALAACGGNGKIPGAAARDDGPPTAPLMPITLVVNPGEKVTQAFAARLTHLQSRVIASSLFTAVDTGMGPSPAVLRLDYAEECPFRLGEFLWNLVSAASALLLPGWQTCTQHIRARAYLGRELVADRKYAATFKGRIWLLAGLRAQGSQAVDIVYGRMERDFRERPPLPAWTPPPTTLQPHET